MSAANKDWPISRAALCVTLLAWGVFVAACAGYATWGAPLLSRLSVSVGEVLMKEGLRLEEAGALENAKERYAAALESRFAGEQNRAYTLKLLGSIYWRDGDYEKAKPLLRAATESDRAEPSFFLPYCDALLHLKAWDELREATLRWQQAVAKTTDTAAMAEAKYFEGRAALGMGDRARAKTAFTDGLRIAPGGKNAAELAQLAFEEKDYPAALAQIDAYLDTTPTGTRADQLRALRARIIASN